MARPLTREADGDYLDGDMRNAPLSLDRHGPARVTIVPIGGGRQQAAYGYTDKLQDEVVAAIKAEDAKPCPGVNPHVADGDVIRMFIGSVRDQVWKVKHALDALPAERKAHMARQIAELSNACGDLVQTVLANGGHEWHYPLVSSFDPATIVSEGGFGPRSYAARRHT